MVDSFSIDVKRGSRDLKFTINAKAGVCWLLCTGFVINVKLEVAQSFPSMTKGEFVGQFSQVVA
jgi:hypothetical protein